MYSRINRIVGLLALVMAAPVWGQCEPEWGSVGGAFGSNESVGALTVFDDGSGAALYAGGQFSAGESVMKWDGASWLPVGTAGLAGGIFALNVFDDGSGPALYAGGQFRLAGGVIVNNIAKWDGTSWSPLGEGVNDEVRALTVFDDGSGPALYAGGFFNSAGGVQASRIAKWDGESWTSLGAEIEGPAVLSLAVFDDGSGPALYAAGEFFTAGGIPAIRIAKWDGTSWSPLAAGLEGSSVLSLAIFDDGSGPAIFAGGSFTTTGGVSVNSVAKWDGTSWSPLGAGIRGGVDTLFVFDDGSGPMLYAGGRFTAASGTPANNIARWDGTSWSPLRAGTHTIVLALTVFDDGSGAALFAGSFGPDIVSRWGPPIPRVSAQPADLTVEVRDPAVFSLTAVSTPGPMSIQWRKDGQLLREDPPRITGTRGTTLRIDSAVPSDTGLYDAVLTNMCGPARTRGAVLTVTCYPDCDQSTGAGVLDLFDFLCFQSSFVSFGAYADCDGNNLLDFFDFLCFQGAFVSGCP